MYTIHKSVTHTHAHAHPPTHPPPTHPLQLVEVLSANAVLFSLEGGRTVGDLQVQQQKQNAKWMETCFGGEVYAELADKPISCSGVTFGSAPAVASYMQTWLEVLEQDTLPACKRIIGGERASGRGRAANQPPCRRPECWHLGAPSAGVRGPPPFSHHHHHHHQPCPADQAVHTYMLHYLGSRNKLHFEYRTLSNWCARLCLCVAVGGGGVHSAQLRGRLATAGAGGAGAHSAELAYASTHPPTHPPTGRRESPVVTATYAWPMHIDRWVCLVGGGVPAAAAGVNRPQQGQASPHACHLRPPPHPHALHRYGRLQRVNGTMPPVVHQYDRSCEGVRRDRAWVACGARLPRSHAHHRPAPPPPHPPPPPFTPPHPILAAHTLAVRLRMLMFSTYPYGADVEVDWPAPACDRGLLGVQAVHTCAEGERPYAEGQI